MAHRLKTYTRSKRRMSLTRTRARGNGNAVEDRPEGHRAHDPIESRGRNLSGALSARALLSISFSVLAGRGSLSPVLDQCWACVCPRPQMALPSPCGTAGRIPERLGRADAGHRVLAVLGLVGLLVPSLGVLQTVSAALLPSVHVADLTGDSLIRPQQVDSLFNVLIAREEFLGGEPASGIMGGYVRLLNPFRISSVATTDTISVTIDLELEQCSYGPPVDTKRELAAFWAFGILGTALSSENAVVGKVQWRARLHRPGQPDVVQAVGQGFCSGDVRKLSRRTAIKVANKRALWNLAFAISEELNRELALRLKKRSVDMSEAAYRKLMDGW